MGVKYYSPMCKDNCQTCHSEWTMCDCELKENLAGQFKRGWIFGATITMGIIIIPLLGLLFFVSRLEKKVDVLKHDIGLAEMRGIHKSP